MPTLKQPAVAKGCGLLSNIKSLEQAMPSDR